MVHGDDSISVMDVDHLALDLAVTIRHDGHGGVADDLAEPAGLTRWAREHAEELAAHGFPPPDDGFGADAEALAGAVEVRTAVRALFARAVLPGPPSAADAGKLPPAAQALARLNAASARVPVTPCSTGRRPGRPPPAAPLRAPPPRRTGSPPPSPAPPSPS